MSDNIVKIVFAEGYKHFILGEGTVGIGMVKRNTEAGPQRAITISNIPTSVIGDDITREYEDTPVDVFLEITQIESLLVLKKVVDYAVDDMLRGGKEWRHTGGEEPEDN